MTTYHQALEAIFAHVDYSRSRYVPYNTETYNLARMRELCDRLGRPQDRYPCLHIAGSKGKGSSAAMLAAMLQAAGLRTGMYTSPHLHTMRERMRIDGALIAPERLAGLWDELRPHTEALPGTTAFEILTAMAFLYFAQAEIDWGVIEVGLGGRLDATNVILPNACAITSISYEHTELLGHTLGLIASEKAGIIKPGIPVVVGPQPPEAMAAIVERAADLGAPLHPVDEEWRWRITAAGPHGMAVDIHGPTTLLDLHLPLTGYHQAANAAVAVAMIDILRRDGRDIPEEAMRLGLASTYWPGRLECLARQPLVLADSAHNGRSAEVLHEALDIFPHERLILLFGASADKHIEGMLEVLAPQAEAIIVTQSRHPRAAQPQHLAGLARAAAPGAAVYALAEVREALELATLLARSEKDLILITGSIFLVAAAREAWNELHPGAFLADDWVHAAESIDAVFTPMLSGPAPVLEVARSR